MEECWWTDQGENDGKGVQYKGKGLEMERCLTDRGGINRMGEE